MRRWLVGLSLAGLGWTSPGCGRAEGGPSSETHPEAKTAQASEQRLLDRCALRWEKVAHNDWIEAYDFFTPAERKTSSLQDFLKGKTNHRYEKPERPRLLKVQGDVGYLLVASLWTPTHPALQNVKLGKEGLTQRLEVVETWRRAEGDWYYVKAEFPPEFFEEHTDITPPKAEPSAQ